MQLLLREPLSGLARVPKLLQVAVPSLAVRFPRAVVVSGQLQEALKGRQEQPAVLEVATGAESLLESIPASLLQRRLRGRMVEAVAKEGEEEVESWRTPLLVYQA